VSWQRFTNVDGCSLPAGTQIACGDYGLFVLLESAPGSPSTTPLCASDADGSETPPSYAPRKLQAHQGVPSVPVTITLAKQAAGIGAPTPAGKIASLPDLPCANGSCFTAHGAQAGSPWIALLDWSDWHGWTVGWTARLASNHELPVVLYAFDDLVDLSPDDEVTDLHVLALACSLAEDIDSGSVPPPAVVNMSFGRPEAQTDSQVTGQCEYLSCQIGQVLSHIQNSSQAASAPPTFVAAIGNHREELFPASLDQVLPVGMLNLARFNLDQQPDLTWETVEKNLTTEPLALMPGYGICLDYLMAGEPHSWPAPAGSSYAAGITSGWLARRQVREPLANPMASLISPIIQCLPEGACFAYLSQSGEPLIEHAPAATKMLARVFGRSDASCGDRGNLSNSILEVYRSVPATGTETLGSSILGVAEVNSPTPGSDPCVPCAMIDGSGGGWKSAPDTQAADSQAASAKAMVFGGPGTPHGIGIVTVPLPPPLILDVSFQSPLPSGQQISQILLRSGDELFDLNLNTAQISNFVLGTYTHMRLHGFNDLFCSGEQPSLLYEIIVEGDPEEHWSSTPISLRGDTWTQCAGGAP
jgi:hypothetical protein